MPHHIVHYKHVTVVSMRIKKENCNNMSKSLAMLFTTSI
jgi:hypothetical protein